MTTKLVNVHYDRLLHCYWHNGTKHTTFDTLVEQLVRDQRAGLNVLYTIGHDSIVFGPNQTYKINHGKWKTFSSLEQVPHKFNVPFLLELFVAFAMATTNDSI